MSGFEKAPTKFPDACPECGGVNGHRGECSHSGLKKQSLRYMSEEWKAEQWRVFEEKHIAGDTSACSGWDGPCGGCARCMGMEFGYYMAKDEEFTHMILRAGLEYAGPLVRLDYFPGFGGYHDSYNCWLKRERTELSFPWEKL